MAKKPAKMRLDDALVERGLAEDKSRAQALIMSGVVYSDTVRLDKPGINVTTEDDITVKGRGHPWVSRGGIKLAHGLKHFEFDPTGLTCVDVGASTGGFSDVLLHNGAAKVYAVDVGHGQLDWKLRSDERVVVMERTNARSLDAAQIPDTIGAVVCDASFIGLRTVLPAAMSLATQGAFLVALIKPQFEVERHQVGEGGVVRDAQLHRAMCDMIHEWLADQQGWRVLGIEQSPIKGPEGNIEFLIGAVFEGV